MKSLLISLLALVSYPKAFASCSCTSKVDSTKVVVFVDTNNSPADIKGAAKAACVRGEAFLKIPSTGNYIDEASLTKELSFLANNNRSVVSMVVSGHNGGSSVHGTVDGVDKFEIINSLKTAYKKKPDLLSDMKSIFMWGCWSMGPLNTTTASHSVLTGLLIRAWCALTGASKLF